MEFSVEDPRNSKKQELEGNEWIFHMNIRSLENPFDDLMIFIEDQNLNKPSVICLTETRLSDDSTLSLFEIPEYHRLISHAGSIRNSGAGIYVHESLR